MKEQAVVRDAFNDELPPEDSHVRRRKLPVARAPLSRHPDDGFVLADPYPLRPSLICALRAMIVALLPPAPAPSPADMVDRIVLHVRTFMSYMHPLAARGFALTLLILDLAPIFLLQSWSRMQKLPPERASELFDQMVHGRFSFMRTLVVAVRGLVLSSYFDQDELHRAIDYAPQPFLRERMTRRDQIVRARTLPPVGDSEASSRGVA